MPTWLQIFSAVVLTLYVPFAGWVIRELMKLKADIAAIGARQDARETECAGRLEWLRTMDAKLDTVAEGTARIEGQLNTLLTQPPER